MFLPFAIAGTNPLHFTAELIASAQDIVRNVAPALQAVRLLLLTPQAQAPHSADDALLPATVLTAAQSTFEGGFGSLEVRPLARDGVCGLHVPDRDENFCH